MIPKAVWEGSLVLFGTKVRCVVLDDGRRVIHEGDLLLLLEAMGKGADCDESELEKFMKWIGNHDERPGRDEN